MRKFVLASPVAAVTVAASLACGAPALAQGWPGAAPPPSPPAYGDARYGDPRFDWRFGQGGWGYGRRPGEWVPIRQRLEWFERRIDRAQKEGRLGRRDARDLRRQLMGIRDLEERYRRDGRMGPGERADLDRRFDVLSQRIHFESDRPGYAPPYGR